MAEITGDDLARVLRAASFSADRHRGQLRKGEDPPPYINHPLEVASILANVGGVSDVTTLVAPLLHDTVEDTSATADYPFQPTHVAPIPSVCRPNALGISCNTPPLRLQPETTLLTA